MKSILQARWFAAALFPFLTAGAVGTAAVPPPSAIVVGFVGGFVRHNDEAHREVQLADELRDDYRRGVDVEVFANHAAQAHSRILSLLDEDGDGSVSGAEKSRA